MFFQEKFVINYSKKQSHQHRTLKAYFSITQSSSCKI